MYRHLVAQCALWRRVKRFEADDRLQVIIYAHPPDKRRRDLDNLLKATLDAIQHAGVYPDDSQIDEILIMRGDVRKSGELEITINSLS